MEHSFLHSTPSQYFTPKKHEHTTDNLDYIKTQKSTAERYYDLEQSFKKYQQLLEQNLYLKNLMLKQQMVQNTQPINDTFSYIPPEQPHQKTNQASHHPKLSRNSSQKCLSTKLQNTATTQPVSHYDSNYHSFIQGNDVRMWSLKHRNQFLEQKLNNLQHQYYKQNKMIHRVKTSEKWKNRFDCKQNTCYQDKYIKLLRVKSPVLLD